MYRIIFVFFAVLFCFWDALATIRSTQKEPITNTAVRNILNVRENMQSSEKNVSEAPSTIYSVSTVSNPSDIKSDVIATRNILNVLEKKTSAEKNVSGVRSTVSRISTTSNSSDIKSDVTARGALNVRETAMNPEKRVSGVRSTVSRIPNTSNFSNINSGVIAREASVSMETTNIMSVETVIKNMESLAELNEFCRNQYINCMDNFCNILDENQGRCSCSDNLKNYSEAEAALKQANESLKEVAQNIKNIGLTAEEIETLFSETEAEHVLVTSNDSTQLKRDLDKIKGLIIDVNTTNTFSQNNSEIDFSLSNLLDFSSDSNAIFDVSKLVEINSNSIGNKRGKALYDIAVARCKANVLNECSAHGVDMSLIMNTYDLEIDKQCMSYQRNLEDANKQLVSTVRNAENVLQRARLMVAKQKNSNDLRKCISDLDICMQDDFVCGDNYIQCLDPTGKYIHNGEIVVGAVFNDDFVISDEKEIEKYLRSKIGVLDDEGNPKGLCANVLSKCQNYVMNNKKYSSDNALVSGYLGVVLPRIAKFQAEIISDYSTSCISDVVTCINNNYLGNTLSSTSIRSCLQVINTCRSLTDTNTSNEFADVQAWLEVILGKTNSEEELPEDEPASQETDIKNCQKIGGSVSSTGTICVIKNVQAPDQLNKQATKYGWAPYINFTSNSVEVNMGSAITGKKVPVNTYLYVMKYAYLTALQKCESLGGTLNISVGEEHNNAYIYCNIDSQNVQFTKEECESLLNVWPQGAADEKTGGFYDYGTKQVCTYMPAGLYYLGKDLGGECLPEMVENQVTGNCTCKPGWCYNGAYSCTENCSD